MLASARTYNRVTTQMPKVKKKNFKMIGIAPYSEELLVTLLLQKTSPFSKIPGSLISLRNN